MESKVEKKDIDRILRSAIREIRKAQAEKETGTGASCARKEIIHEEV